MSEVVPNVPKVHRIGHVGAGGMPHPVRRRVLNKISQAFKLGSSLTNTRCGAAKYFLNDQMHGTAGQ